MLTGLHTSVIARTVVAIRQTCAPSTHLRNRRLAMVYNNPCDGLISLQPTKSIASVQDYPRSTCFQNPFFWALRSSLSCQPTLSSVTARAGLLPLPVALRSHLLRQRQHPRLASRSRLRLPRRRLRAAQRKERATPLLHRLLHQLLRQLFRQRLRRLLRHSPSARPLRLPAASRAIRQTTGVALRD